MPKYKVETPQGNFMVELDKAPDSPAQLKSLVEEQLSQTVPNLNEMSRKISSADPIPFFTPEEMEFPTTSFLLKQAKEHPQLTAAILPSVLATIGAKGGLKGIGLGGALGEKLNQSLFPLLLGQEAPSTTGHPALDPFVSGAGEVAGDVLFRPIAKGVKTIASALGIVPAENAPRILEAFEETGVVPKVTDVAGSRLPAMAERGVQQMMTGQNIVTEAVEGQAKALSSASNDFLTSLGGAGAKSAVTTGEEAAKAITDNLRIAKQIEDGLYDSLSTMAKGVTVPLNNLKATATEILRQQRNLLPSQQNKKLISITEEILGVTESVRWDRVRSWQKKFGRDITPDVLFSDTPAAEAKMLWAAVTEDMKDRAASSPQAISKAFNEATDFSRVIRETFNDSAVANVLKVNPEEVLKKIDVLGGPTAIKRAKDAILGTVIEGKPIDRKSMESWNLIRRHILEGIFETAEKGGVVQSAKGFATPMISDVLLEKKLGKIGKETLEELLNPLELKALGNIRVVAKAIRTGERIGSVGGTSITPQGLGFQTAIGAFGAGIGSTVGTPGVGGFLGFVFAPPAIAKLLVNPRAAAYIASPEFSSFARNLVKTGVAAKETGQILSRLAGYLVSTGGESSEPLPQPPQPFGALLPQQ